MNEPNPDDYRKAVRSVMTSAQFCVTDLGNIIKRHPPIVADEGRRARALSIARTQIELGVAMLLVAIDL